MSKPRFKMSTDSTELVCEGIRVRKGRMIERDKEDYWQELIFFVDQNVDGDKLQAFIRKYEDEIEDFRMS